MNLNQLVDELGLLVRHKLSNQNIRLVRDLQADLPDLLGDAPQLEQAFLNLILNAAEAMPRGGTLTIRTHAAPPPVPGQNGQQVTIEFKDTGAGMTEEMQRGAFTAMLATTKAKGNGLGLAIVGRIIETHRGLLGIKSRPGKGTTIRIDLPVK